MINHFMDVAKELQLKEFSREDREEGEYQNSVEEVAENAMMIKIS